MLIYPGSNWFHFVFRKENWDEKNSVISQFHISDTFPKYDDVLEVLDVVCLNHKKCCLLPFSKLSTGEQVIHFIIQIIDSKIK